MKPTLKLVASIFLLLSVAYIDNVKCAGDKKDSPPLSNVSTELTPLVGCLTKLCQNENIAAFFHEIATSTTR